MIHLVDVGEKYTLDDYSSSSLLAVPVEELRRSAKQLEGVFDERTVWMVNSTASGGGVAEMLPKVVSILRELGVMTNWAVIESDETEYFALTKRIHNLLHGVGDPRLGGEEGALFDSVSRSLFREMKELVRPRDVLVVHDPQPIAVGAMLKRELGLPAIWRCHVGLDEVSAATEAAWSFLKPWAREYDSAIFSMSEYVPRFLRDRSGVIHPAIDPLSDKNRELSVHQIAGILSNAALANAANVTLRPPFEAPAQRLQVDGSFAPANVPEDIGLLHRPIVTQVSRWDRLKGFLPLLSAFAELKARRRSETNSIHLRRLELARLVLAGPDPSSVHDDPEGQEVFQEVCRVWQGLESDVQRDVAVLVLPMGSRKENALMVNALQRCSTIVVQNSLREGFGLTITEAMWKRRPVLGSQAAGIREQVRDGVHGRLVQRHDDSSEIAAVLDDMLRSPEKREAWAWNAQREAIDRFLIFSQVRRWLHVLSQALNAPSYPSKSQEAASHQAA